MVHSPSCLRLDELACRLSAAGCAAEAGERPSLARTVRASGATAVEVSSSTASRVALGSRDEAAEVEATGAPDMDCGRTRAEGLLVEGARGRTAELARA
jgi:hypothetical protein